MNTKEKLVLVGCGMASGKLVEEILLLPDSERFEITVIGEEPDGNYDRIRLYDILTGDEIEDLLINSRQWFQERNISTYLGEVVREINREAKTVVTNKDRTLAYDHLVLATGSQPAIPNESWRELPGVFTFRNIDDARSLQSWITSRQKAMVIGGGLPGLEIADVLLKLGKDVTVSHFAECVMEKALNFEAALVVEKHLERRGIKLIKDNHVTEIQQKEAPHLLEAKFHDGSAIETDCIVINCGIIPRKELAQSCGLRSVEGVVVDEKLRTSDPHIYALGECIEFENHRYGQIVPIYNQARVLSKVLSGYDVQYTHTTAPITRMKSDIPVVSIGKIKEDDEDEVITYNNPVSHIYKKLIVRDNIVEGAHFVGDDLNAEALGVYHQSKLPLPNRIEDLLFPGSLKPGAPPKSVYWPNEVIVCDCNGISCGHIRQAIREVGPDIDLVKDRSRGAINCGLCESRIQSIIDNTFDTIIVGAGLGGLTTGAKLAKDGKKVLIIESHDKVGGYATSFTREGFCFDASLHNMGPMNGTIEKIFHNLGLDKKVEYIPFDYFQRVIFPDHDFIIQKGLNIFEEYLIGEFPQEKQGIQGIIEEMRNVRKGFEEIEALTLDGKGDDEVSPMLAIKYPQFVELVFTTFDELSDNYIKDPTLKGLLSNLWWYFGLPPSEVAAILYSVPGVSYLEYSGGYIKGTSQALSNSLAEIIVENGGRILLNTRVNRILVSDQKVDGVLVDDGQVFYSDVVVSNAGALNTFQQLVDSQFLKKKYLKKVKRLENSLSALQLYIGLDCPPEELGITEHSFTVFSGYDHEKNYQDILDGEYSRTFYSCMAYSQVDPSLAPKDKGILHLFSLDHIKNWEGLTRSEYVRKKKSVTQQILDKAEQRIPHLKDHIVVTELGTPATMKRYTSNPEGAVYGPSQIITQSGLNRFKPETPVSGLFLVGSSIYPGGGYPSVLSSGYRVAHMILRAEQS